MADVIAGKVLSEKKTYPSVPKGVVLSQKAEYTILAGGNPGIDDTLKMMPIPQGAELIDFILEGDDGTASMTISVGDGTIADKFMAAVDASAAFSARMNAALGTLFTTAGSLFITFGVAAPTATHKYTMVVMYRIP
jgi:hypothetical protein